MFSVFSVFNKVPKTNHGDTEDTKKKWSGSLKAELKTLAKRLITLAALDATARVQSAAGRTLKIHGSCEPAGDDRAAAQDGDQDGSIQKEILQLLRVSTTLL